MTFFQSIILGLVQGLTEFIPVSSTGHLVIARQFMNLGEGGLAFDAVLQLATACAVLLYFWKDIKSLFISFFKWIAKKQVDADQSIMLQSVIVGTIPAVVLGILLESYMDTTFRTMLVVIITLILGSILMYVAELYAKRRGYDEPLSLYKALTVGAFQCLALLPGMSRSGATISGGLFAGLNREMAVRLSFLLSFPILFGTGLKKLTDIFHSSYNFHDYLVLATGAITAFIVGLCAIHFLITYLRKHTMQVFVWYRIVLVVVLLLIFV
jgi:undecaprenyl-diphosphatase